MADISESSRKAVDAVDPRHYYAHYRENKWAAAKGHLDETTPLAAEPVILVIRRAPASHSRGRARIDSITQNAVLSVKMSAPASTPVYFLTQMGEKKWRSVNDDVLELEERLLRGLSRDEVRALNRSLETIIRNMTPTP